MIQTLAFKVAGMTCGGCENAVKRTIAQLPGVISVTASHSDGRVEVTCDDESVTREVIADRIRRTGYEVTP
ncbi:MAG: heavy-metal-associated domain-containing protein [Vicinamibacterales bacterium]